MQMSPKSFTVWLLAGLIAGAVLGGWLGMGWKEREIEARVAAAVEAERDRVKPLSDERDALRSKLERSRLMIELGHIAAEAERKNFGLARERLDQLGEDLGAVAGDERYREALEGILARRQEISGALDGLDPEAAGQLRALQADLQAVFEQD